MSSAGWMFRLCSAKFDGETTDGWREGRGRAGGRGKCFKGMFRNSTSHPSTTTRKSTPPSFFLPRFFPNFFFFCVSFLFFSLLECSRYSKHFNAFIGNFLFDYHRFERSNFHLHFHRSFDIEFKNLFINGGFSRNLFILFSFPIDKLSSRHLKVVICKLFTFVSARRIDLKLEFSARVIISHFHVFLEFQQL